MIKITLGIILSIIFAIQAVTLTFHVLMKGDSLVMILPVWLVTIVTGYFSWMGLKNRKIRKTNLEHLLQKENIKKELLYETSHKYIDVKYLGGAGNKLNESEVYSIGVMREKIRFITKNNEVWDVDFSDVVKFEVGGAGTTTTNAGISGGGFGLEGFIKGAVTAAVINAATTKSTTNTFLKITTKDGEMFLHTSMCEPAELRIILSPLSVALAKNINSDKNQIAGIADELSKLNELKNSGIINADDFEAAKRKLLT